MADRGKRFLVVAAVAVAALALPAGASAGLSPWLVGASPVAAPSAPVVPTVDITYRHRLGKPCRGGTATLTLVRGGKRWTAQVPAAEVAALWPPDTDIALVTPDGWTDSRTAPLSTYMTLVAGSP